MQVIFSGVIQKIGDLDQRMRVQEGASKGEFFV
jgi:hypothetical protein